MKVPKLHIREFEFEKIEELKRLHPYYRGKKTCDILHELIGVGFAETFKKIPNFWEKQTQSLKRSEESSEYEDEPVA